jgi:TetR/AcrR family transcriptional repressor of nem operon
MHQPPICRVRIDFARHLAAVGKFCGPRSAHTIYFAVAAVPFPGGTGKAGSNGLQTAFLDIGLNFLRYQKGHKNATRTRIVKVAAKRFRKEGAKAAGVAGLMADAGLTHGGFYAHFDSKEELFRDALAYALDETLARVVRLVEAEGGGLEAMVRDYLETWHIKYPERGCAAAALAPEVARHSRRTRAAFEKKLEGFIELIAAQIAGSDRAARRRRAIAIFGLIMGTLQLARAVADRTLSDQIRESGISAALALGRRGKI